MADAIKGITIELGEDTSSLEMAMKRLGREANTLNKELYQVERGLKFDPSNTVLLAQKTEILKEKVAGAKLQVEALQQAQARVEAMFKAGQIDRGQYRTFQRDLEIAKGKLATFEAQVKSVGVAQDTASAKTSGWGAKLKSFAGVMGVTMAIGALTAFVTRLLENVDALEKLSDKTGLSTERLQELKYVGEDLGVDLDTMASAQAKLTKAMNAGRDGSGAQAEAFKKLGINVTNADGSLRDAKVVMQEAFGALNKVGNETERDAMAMQIFGKGAQELNPLIVAGTDKLNSLAQAARDSGAVMSGDAVAALDAFGDGIDHLKQIIMVQLGEAFAAIMGWMQEHKDTVTSVVDAIKTVLEKVWGIMQSVWDVFAAAWPAISGATSTAWAIVGPVLSTMEVVFSGVAAAIQKAVDAWNLLNKLMGGGEPTYTRVGPGAHPEAEARIREQLANAPKFEIVDGKLVRVYARGGIVPGFGPVPVIAHGGEPILPTDNPMRALQLIAQSGVLNGLGRGSSTVSNSNTRNTYNINIDRGAISDYNGLISSIQAAIRLQGA